MQGFGVFDLVAKTGRGGGPLRISSTSSKNGKVYVFLIIKWVFTNLQPAQELSHGYQHLVGKVRSSLG